jgi:NADH-quinone oxidoreductase subunit H
MVVAIASVMLTTGSASIADIATAQTNAWFALTQPVAFVLFLIALVASLERNPFDLIEAESELVSGWKTEYGGVYFSLTLLAEYVKLLVGCVLCVALFLGGTSVGGDIGFIIKVLIITLLMFYIRATALRLRLDQIFRVVWTRFIPLGLLNVVVTALVMAFTGGSA